MKDANGLMRTSRVITLKIMLEDFQKLVIKQIIKEKGIDLTGRLYCGVDHETNGIFIDLIEDDLTEEENDKLYPYNINESYENTKTAIHNMLGVMFTNNINISMYAKGNSKRTPLENIMCEITIYN